LTLDIRSQRFKFLLPEVKRFRRNGGAFPQETVAKRFLPQQKWYLQDGIALVGDQGIKRVGQILAQENIQLLRLRIGEEFGKDMLGLCVGGGALPQAVRVETRK